MLLACTISCPSGRAKPNLLLRENLSVQVHSVFNYVNLYVNSAMLRDIFNLRSFSRSPVTFYMHPVLTRRLFIRSCLYNIQNRLIFVKFGTNTTRINASPLLYRYLRNINNDATTACDVDIVVNAIKYRY